MIKEVLFIGALLVPGLAYGANPSAPLSVEVVPAGSAPAPAVAAGFTTLAANYDFSSSFYATQSNWLGCYPHDGNDHQWYQGLWWNGGGEPPCADAIKQSFDPRAGTNVLDLVWDPAWNGLGGFNGENHINTQKHDQSKATSFTNAYYEVEMRHTPLTDGAATAFWSSSDVLGNGDLEWDFVEIWGPQYSLYNAAIHNWGNNQNGTNFIWHGVSGSFDATQYHKYAVLITSDGSTMSGCAYVDDVLRACVNPQAAGREFNLRNFLILHNGTQGSPTEITHTYVKSVRVWSCGNWETTMCNGTVLTGAP